jgi:hypothetical protein
MKIVVIQKDGHLEAAVTGQGKMELLAKSETDFYVKGVFLKVHFEENKNNKVTGFQLKQYTGGSFIRKIN